MNSPYSCVTHLVVHQALQAGSDNWQRLIWQRGHVDSAYEYFSCYDDTLLPSRKCANPLCHHCNEVDRHLARVSLIDHALALLKDSLLGCFSVSGASFKDVEADWPMIYYNNATFVSFYRMVCGYIGLYDKYKRTMMHYSAVMGPPERILFYAHHLDRSNTADINGFFPIHYAIYAEKPHHLRQLMLFRDPVEWESVTFTANDGHTYTVSCIGLLFLSYLQHIKSPEELAWKWTRPSADATECLSILLDYGVSLDVPMIKPLPPCFADFLAVPIQYPTVFLSGICNSDKINKLLKDRTTDLLHFTPMGTPLPLEPDCKDKRKDCVLHGARPAYAFALGNPWVWHHFPPCQPIKQRLAVFATLCTLSRLVDGLKDLPIELVKYIFELTIE